MNNSFPLYNNSTDPVMVNNIKVPNRTSYLMLIKSKEVRLLNIINE